MAASRSNVSGDASPAVTQSTEFSTWRSGAAALAAADALGAVVEQHFGAVTKQDPLRQLRRGLIGVAIDDQSQAFVVVTDPELVDEAALQDQLSGTVGVDLEVRVQPGCFSADALLTAATVISDRTWHPDASRTSFTYELDPYDSRWHVVFPQSAHDVGDALAARLGRFADVTYAKDGGGQRL